MHHKEKAHEGELPSQEHPPPKNIVLSTICAQLNKRHTIPDGMPLPMWANDKNVNKFKGKMYRGEPATVLYRSEISQTRPLSVTMAEKVESMRAWARDRAVGAN